MTLGQAVVFAGGMAFWAALPGPGLAAVISRTLGAGPLAGLAVIAGLVVADVAYLVIAAAGLVAIATTLGPLFRLVKYAAAAYLIWRGWRLLTGTDRVVGVVPATPATRWRDMGFGALITLSNPKAILFYGAILPAFFDVRTVGLGGFTVLAGLVALVSFVVYGGCIALTQRLRHRVASTRAARRVRQAMGSMLIVSGVAVATR